MLALENFGGNNVDVKNVGVRKLWRKKIDIKMLA